MVQQIPTVGPDTLVPPTPLARAPYFVYGSLMSSAVLFSIIGPKGPDSLTAKCLKKNQMARATLYNHKRHAVKWADFPAVIRTDKPEDSVEGYLVSGLTEVQEARIKRFESGLYTDEGVEVVMGWGKACGEVKEARVYVWGGTEAELVDTAVDEWSFERFKKSDMYRMSFRGGAGASDSEED